MGPKRKPPSDLRAGGGVKKPRFLYTEEAMALAIQAIREGQCKTRQAAREFAVPFSTLQAKVTGKHPEGRRMGPKTILTSEEEDLLVSFIVAKAKKGFPLQKRTLLETVQNIITDDGRETPFKNNKPGNSWLSGFFKRHPQITQCHAEVINRGRAKVTEEKIRGWGTGLRDYLKEVDALDILDDPSRIYNADESGFRTNPETGLVLGPVNYENFYIVKDGSEKESISSLFTANAAGEVVPPCVVFPYVRIPREIAMNCNPEWSLGRSPSGWMTGQVFFGYIGNTFIPWLKSHNIKFPVLLLIDGHRSHLTLNVCRLCEANDIILYSLLPNATHIIQPLDVSVFRALKSGWKVTVDNWKEKSENRVLTRAKFPQLFESVVNEKATPKVIQNGFRKCGIFPFNLDSIDYTKCIDHSSRMSETTSSTNPTTVRNFVSAKPTNFGVEHLLYIESCMEGSRAEEFRSKENTSWDGEESAQELFKLWKKLRTRCLAQNGEEQQQAEEQAELAEEQSIILDTNLQGSEENQNIDRESTGEILNKDDGRESSQIEKETSSLDGIGESEIGEPVPGTSNQEPQSIVKTPKKIPECKQNVSPAFLHSLVWPTESPNKKNKKINQNLNVTKERLPHAVSSKKWLGYWESQEEKKEKKIQEKERKAKERKEKKEKKCESSVKKLSKKKDWICPRCKGSYNKDVGMCNGREWVGPCNQCDVWYHKNCVSKKILTEFGLQETSFNDDETDFICDTCFGDTDDELEVDFLENLNDEID